MKFHRHIFYAASNEEPHKATFREYVTRFEAHIRVTAIAIDTHPELLQPTTDYKAPQAFGRQARLDEKWAIQYPSVRHKGGICYAVMRPDALQPARQGSHFEFIWDGQTISDIYALKPENLS
ncbi:MAG: RES family NAD+ phosphorylase [Gammaproteobacteria bacterium]|nr:RES family NAD+ phosphorylase [Gammaproteobacteria bacterium]